MRCKPNEIAIVVSGWPETNIGRVIRVIEPSTPFGIACWSFEGDLGAARYVEDACLRPIRDPGDDAIDWISKRTPRSVDLRQDAITRARKEQEHV